MKKEEKNVAPLPPSAHVPRDHPPHAGPTNITISQIASLSRIKFVPNYEVIFINSMGEIQYTHIYTHLVFVKTKIQDDKSIISMLITFDPNDYNKPI